MVYFLTCVGEFPFAKFLPVHLLKPLVDIFLVTHPDNSWVLQMGLVGSWPLIHCLTLDLQYKDSHGPLSGVIFMLMLQRTLLKKARSQEALCWYIQFLSFFLCLFLSASVCVHTLPPSTRIPQKPVRFGGWLPLILFGRWPMTSSQFQITQEMILFFFAGLGTWGPNSWGQVSGV